MVQSFNLFTITGLYNVIAAAAVTANFVDAVSIVLILGYLLPSGTKTYKLC